MTSRDDIRSEEPTMTLSDGATLGYRPTDTELRLLTAALAEHDLSRHEDPAAYLAVRS